MSIRRSGLRSIVYLICKEDIDISGVKLKKDEKYELVHDIGSLYVLKTSTGEELIAPKDIFREVEQD